MSKVTSVPSGVAEYTPSQYQRFDSLRHTISQVYKSFGYFSLETSTVQYLDVLASGGAISKEIYSLGRAKAEETSTEANRGLRFDLTKPMARYVAEKQGSLVFPFKRTEIGLVYRGERPQKGRFRQFYQADFDVVGRDTLALDYDAEMLEVAATIFEKLKLGKVVVRFNNRKLLQALLEAEGVEPDKFVIALGIIDKIEKVTKEQTVISLTELVSLSEAQANSIVDLVSHKIILSEVADFVQTLITKFPSIETAAREVMDVSELVSVDTNLVEIQLDLSIARGLEYYTGTVFETNLIGCEQYGSICSGGRYENLVGDFATQAFPGVGGSVGLSRLFAMIEHEQLTFVSTVEEPKTLFVAVADLSKIKQSRAYAQILRNQGNTVLVAAGDQKLKKQFELASKLGVQEVLILEDKGVVSVKDMTTGLQTQRFITQ